jgi:hypothetical protein
MGDWGVGGGLVWGGGGLVEVLWRWRIWRSRTGWLGEGGGGGRGKGIAGDGHLAPKGDTIIGLF